MTTILKNHQKVSDLVLSIATHNPAISTPHLRYVLKTLKINNK